MSFKQTPGATAPTQLASIDDTGSLGVKYLKQFWSQVLARRKGVFIEPTERSWRFDNLLLNGLGLPIEETLQYLMQHAPDFAAFEGWILGRNGGQLDPLQVQRLNSLFAGQPYPEALAQSLRELAAADDVLSAADLAFWEEHGYVILRAAVSKE